MLSEHKGIVTVRRQLWINGALPQNRQKSQSLARIDAQKHDFSEVCSAASIGAMGITQRLPL